MCENQYSTYVSKFDYIIETLSAQNIYVFDKKSDQYKYLDANSMLEVVDKIGDNLLKNQLVQDLLIAILHF